MRIWKNLLLTSLFAILTTGAFAQVGIGAGLSFGTDVSEVGIFARGSYQFAEQWRGAATFNYYLAGNEGGVSVSFWDINLDAHYLFWENEQFRAYALGGLGIAIISVDANVPSVPGFDYNESTSDFGINLGAGGEYKVNENVRPFAELKFDVGLYNQLVIMAGVKYLFNN